MKINNQFFIILFFLTNTTHAQNLYIGLKAGINYTNVIAQYFDDKVSKTGLCTGITLDYTFTNKIMLSADLLYSQRGFGNYFLFGNNISATGSVSTGRELVYFHYDYISVPLKIGFSRGKNYSAFGNVGLIPSYLVNSKTVFEDGSSNDNTDKVSKFDLAGQLELGFGYTFKESYFIYTSFSFVHSFTHLTNENYLYQVYLKNYGLNASIGIKYKFKK